MSIKIVCKSKNNAEKELRPSISEILVQDAVIVLEEMNLEATPPARLLLLEKRHLLRVLKQSSMRLVLVIIDTQGA